MFGDKKKARGANDGSPLGQRLLEVGLINEEQLNLALREQKRRGGYLGKVLSALGAVDPNTIARFLAEEVGTEAVDVLRYPVQKEALRLLSYELAQRYEAFPLERYDDTKSFKVAVANPFDVLAMDAIEQISGYIPYSVVASSEDIQEAIERNYRTERSVGATIDELMEIKRESDSDRSLSEDPPLVRLVEQVISRAIELGASDIHFEPEETWLRVRMRIDGILHQEVLVPGDLKSAVIARLKILAQLDSAEQRLPQDGRASFNTGQNEVNLRVSILPTCYGENAVLRILDRSHLNLELPDIGLSGSNLEGFQTMLEAPYGVILVTGPTGSGKTTTLYSALGAVNQMERSVFTLEDPVEYRLPMVRQTQINEEIGMTFAEGLRALLRQDPDVILVGESRDTETAQLMIRAALTGHLVFSTLHTNSAMASITRLVNMGVEPYLLPAALEGIVAQRLVRRICKGCVEEAERTAETFSKLGLEVAEHAPERLRRGRGCSACNGTGFRGRRPLFEVFEMREEFTELVLNRASTQELERLAKHFGMTPLFEDGVERVYEGETTIEEVLRVVPKNKAAGPTVKRSQPEESGGLGI